MSAIKGIKKDPESITKDYESITKDYETLFYSIKDQCKKNFRITFQAIHSNFPVLVVSVLRLLYNSGF